MFSGRLLATSKAGGNALFPLPLILAIACLLVRISVLFPTPDLSSTPVEIPTTTTTTTVPPTTTTTERQEPDPAPSVDRGMGDDVGQWASLVAAYFESGDVDRILCLIGFESGGNPDAKNPSSGARGLLQIMPFWASEYGLAPDDLYDPDTNLRIGRKIRDSQGWTAWSPYKRGECRRARALPRPRSRRQRSGRAGRAGRLSESRSE